MLICIFLIQVFKDMMEGSALGRHRFREFLMNSRGDVPAFDLWYVKPVA